MAALTTRATGDTILAADHNEIRNLLELGTTSSLINVGGKGASIASSSTLTLGTDGTLFHVTGATGITAISNPGSGSGTQIVLVFDSTPTLTHSANLYLMGAANYTAVAKDVLVFRYDGASAWLEVSRNGTVPAASLPLHASRHNSGGADVMAAATATVSGLVPTPPNNITTFLRGDATFATPVSASGGTPALVLSTANTAGVAATFIRTDDTILAFDATVPVTQASADAAATGSAAVAARRDHKHGMPVISSASGGTPALVLGTANTAGAAATFIRTDDTILAFDATVSTTQAFSDAADAGTGAVASRRNHKHGMPAHAASTSGHVIKEIGHETRGADGTDSTTSTSYVDIGTSASVTMTADASDKMTCVTSGTFYNSTAFAEARIALRVDAVAVANGNVVSQRQGANGGIYAGLSLTCQFTGLTAASHTVEQQWKTDSGTFFSYSGTDGGKSLTVWRHA